VHAVTSYSRPNGVLDVHSIIMTVFIPKLINQSKSETLYTRGHIQVCMS